MENRDNRNNNALYDFFEGLSESYQRYQIEKMQKKPPDSIPNTTQADSAGKGTVVQVSPQRG